MNTLFINCKFAAVTSRNEYCVQFHVCSDVLFSKFEHNISMYQLCVRIDAFRIALVLFIYTTSMRHTHIIARETIVIEQQH